VDKPRRRKQNKFPWKKVVAVVVVVLLAGVVGWYVYSNYVYRAPPVYVRVSTSLGSFDVELFPACAPKTVANFVSLVNSGFYSDLAWHRIVKGFVIQTGDPNSRGAQDQTRPNWGSGGSNNTIPLEVGICSWIGNYQGYLGMARTGNATSGLDTATSQFYINLSNSTSNLQLNSLNYATFGKVIDNFSVVQAIGNSVTLQSLCVGITNPPSECSNSWPTTEPYPAVLVNSIVMLPGPPASVSTTT